MMSCQIHMRIMRLYHLTLRQLVTAYIYISKVAHNVPALFIKRNLSSMWLQESQNSDVLNRPNLILL